MDIPEKIKTAAKSLIDMYGLSFDYLGKYEGKEVYSYHFPDDICVGFPFVYLLKDDVVSEITGFEALDIVNLSVENFYKIKVE